MGLFLLIANSWLSSQCHGLIHIVLIRLSQVMKVQGYAYFISSYIENMFLESGMNCKKSIRYNCPRNSEAIWISTVKFLPSPFSYILVRDQRKWCIMPYSLYLQVFWDQSLSAETNQNKVKQNKTLDVFLIVNRSLTGLTVETLIQGQIMKENINWQEIFSWKKNKI